MGSRFPGSPRLTALRSGKPRKKLLTRSCLPLEGSHPKRDHVLAGRAKPALEGGVVPTLESRSRSCLRVRGTLGRSEIHGTFQVH